MAEEPICVLRITMVNLLFSPDAGLVHLVPEASRQKTTDTKSKSVLSKKTELKPKHHGPGLETARSMKYHSCVIPEHNIPYYIACSVSAAIRHPGFINSSSVRA